MNKEIKEALERIGSLVFSDIPSKLQLRKDIATIRTILEAYGKPKTVSREWVENTVADMMTARDNPITQELLLTESLKDEGIEVKEEK